MRNIGKAVCGGAPNRNSRTARENRLRGVAGLIALVSAFGCASRPEPQPERVTIIRPPEPEPERGGLSPTEMQDVLLELERRMPTSQRCYQDELTARFDAGFQGAVSVLITLAPAGDVVDARVLTTTLNSPEVETCLIEKIRSFGFPETEQGGQVRYDYAFRPAY